MTSLAAVLVLLATASASPALPPGYVNDSSCASCHAAIAKTYREVGMSRSFRRPRENEAIENFAKLPFRHERSGDVMELRWRGRRLIFRRWQLDPAGRQANVFEQPVDWILGSGDHARTYLYQTPAGELYQLPLAWYSHTNEWAMAPGYDRADHEGVGRRARSECLFCHDAYAALPKDEVSGYWRDQSFPVQLPEGVGCQRCHGPGAEHVRLASSGAESAALRASIVQPARLAPTLRNDVCAQCHLQPSVAFPGIRRFGRDVESFRPGEALPSYVVHLDVVDRGVAPADRFEINHHPYRLEQSRCFRESAGRLSCLSCHDPHRKTAEVRPVCLSCHEKAHRASEDCAGCHMPKRRPQDVVRVLMTDHRIGIYANPAALRAPRDERDPEIDDVLVTDGPRAPADAELYRVVAAVRAGSGDAARKLEQILAAAPPTAVEPYLDLAAAQLRQKHYGDAEKSARLVLSRAPDHPLALEILGLARGAQGARDEAIDLLRKSARLDPTRPEPHYDLALQLAARGDRADAAAELERAIALRPNFTAAWLQLGRVRKEREGKIEAYEHALAIDPRSRVATAGLTTLQR